MERGQGPLTNGGPSVRTAISVERRVDAIQNFQFQRFFPQTNAQSLHWHLHLRLALDQIANLALGADLDVQRHVVDQGARWERQQPRGGVRHVRIEVVRVPARVGDVLQLRHERRVEREDIPVRLRAVLRRQLQLRTRRGPGLGWG